MTVRPAADPTGDLITYMVRSRRSRTLAAVHAEKRIDERLGITGDMDPDEAAQQIRHAIEQAPAAAEPNAG